MPQLPTAAMWNGYKTKSMGLPINLSIREAAARNIDMARGGS
jgi:hypothetical protein